MALFADEDKLDRFIALHQPDPLALEEVASVVWLQKLDLEFKQQFGEMTAKELEAVYQKIQYLNNPKASTSVDSTGLVTQVPITNREVPIISETKKKVAKRKKRRSRG